MKLFAYYLPQFHEIKENNEMWGKGFTEWTNVRKATPLFQGHEQPVEPLNDNYYDLLNDEIMEWQANIAQEYGIYAFCFYHYWYNGHLLMEKPLYKWLENSNIKMPYCICWANHDWTTGWVDKERKVIFSQNYDDPTDWDKHFEFFLPFFKDERYIKEDGKPFVVVYEAARIDNMNNMLDRWEQLAKENGFPGLCFAYQSVVGDTILGFDSSRFEYDIEYQPMYVREFSYKKNTNKTANSVKYLGHKIKQKAYKILGKNEEKKYKVTIFDYDDIWKKTLEMGPITEKSIPGAFVRMDTTPRIQERGIVTQGMTPEKFKEYLSKQIIRCRNDYHQDKMFIFAWNEWAEGGYLEPDKKWGYKVLEAIRQALIDTNELEK